MLGMFKLFIFLGVFNLHLELLLYYLYFMNLYNTWKQNKYQPYESSKPYKIHK